MAHFYADLAKEAVERYIKKGEVISPFTPLEAQLLTGFNDLPSEALTQRAGTFVTIMENENLRGCIGTYLPTKNNVAEEIIHNAIAAAKEDYRFNPVRKEELSELSYAVYILSKPLLVRDLKELDPKKYGIIVKTVPISPTGDVVFNGHFVTKTGLLLPDLKGVEIIEKQILIACQKGGIDCKLEKILIYKFTAEKYL